MNLIPEFRWNAAELDAFLYAADQSKSEIPEGGSDEPLIRIVLIKLKSNSAAYFKRIEVVKLASCMSLGIV